MIPGQCKRNRFRPHDLSLVNRFALNHIPARKKIIFTVNKNVPTPVIEGQLNTAERELLMRAIKEAPVKPRVAIEVGTWRQHLAHSSRAGRQRRGSSLGYRSRPRDF
jgi:hypothetical protein